MQIRGDGFTHPWSGFPTTLHPVVVPGFCPIKARSRSSCYQTLMGEPVAGRMGQEGQPTRRLDGLHHRIGSQGRSNDGLPLDIGGQGGSGELEAKGQYMHQTSLQEGTDFHPTPEVWHPFSLGRMAFKTGMGLLVGPSMVVIRDGQMFQPQPNGLRRQIPGSQASITAGGVAVEVEAPWTALGPHLT